MSAPKDKRGRTVIYVTPETTRRWEAATVLTGCKSKSDFASRAIDFYAGYIAAETHTDFFADIIPKMVTASVRGTENRLARLHFKSAVELAKLAHLLASVAEVDDETLRQLHIRCVNEVKRINGVLTLETAVHERADD